MNADSRAQRRGPGPLDAMAAIALNTAREAIRDRILYLLLAFALVLMIGARFLALMTVGSEDKVIKDACDIYALLWHSPHGIDSVLGPVRADYPGECRSGLDAITHEVAGRASGHLGVDVESYLGVVRRLGP